MPRKADDTIMMRVIKAHKEQIRRAAELTGKSVSAFILDAALKEACLIELAKEKREHGN